MVIHNSNILAVKYIQVSSTVFLLCITFYFDDVDPDHLPRDFPSWLVYSHHILILIIVLFSSVC